MGQNKLTDTVGQIKWHFVFNATIVLLIMCIQLGNHDLTIIIYHHVKIYVEWPMTFIIFKCLQRRPKQFSEEFTLSIFFRHRNICAADYCSNITQQSNHEKHRRPLVDCKTFHFARVKWRLGKLVTLNLMFNLSGWWGKRGARGYYWRHSSRGRGVIEQTLKWGVSSSRLCFSPTCLYLYFSTQ